MTARPVTSIIDEQLAEAELRHSILLRRGESLPQRLGLPPETRLVDSPIRSPMSIKGGRKWLEVRS